HRQLSPRAVGRFRRIGQNARRRLARAEQIGRIPLGIKPIDVHERRWRVREHDSLAILVVAGDDAAELSRHSSSSIFQLFVASRKTGSVVSPSSMKSTMTGESIFTSAASAPTMADIRCGPSSKATMAIA